MPRLIVTHSPSGDPKVGTVLTVSDAVAKHMLLTGKVELHTDPPEFAGGAASAELSPSAQELYDRKQAEQPTDGTPAPDATPESPTATPDGTAAAGDVDPVNDPAMPSGPADVNTSVETSSGTAAPKPSMPKAPKA
jgi:hypothetical protein